MRELQNSRLAVKIRGLQYQLLARKVVQERMCSVVTILKDTKDAQLLGELSSFVSQSQSKNVSLQTRSNLPLSRFWSM